MITKEQEAKLKALQAETAMYNAMIEDRERLIKKGEEILEKLEEMDREKEAEIESYVREIAFLKEYIRNEEIRLKKRS